MAKKTNVVVMAERLYTLAEDACIDDAIKQFGFRKVAEVKTEEDKATNDKFDKARAMMRHHFRNFVQKLNAHGTLDQSILTSIGVLADEG